MPAPRPRTTRLLRGRDDARSRGDRAPGRGGGSTAAGEPTPARTFSGRFLALTLVAVLIVFLAAPTTKIFLEQRAEIAALEASIADMEAEQDSLERQVEQWSDETYVKQQARDRLLYVMPGERSYLVVGAEEMEGAVVDSSAAQAEAEQPAWVDALWGSVVASAYAEPGEADGATDGAGGDQDAEPADGAGSTGETAVPETGTEPQDTARPEDAAGTGAPEGTGNGTGSETPGEQPQDAATETSGTAAE